LSVAAFAEPVLLSRAPFMPGDRILWEYNCKRYLQQSYSYGIPFFVTSDEYDRLISDVTAWCEPRGKRVELAKALGLSRQHITNILAKRKMLSFEQAIAIKKIIGKPKARRKS
jgi:hypothetical protein